MAALDEYSVTALPLTMLCKGAAIGQAIGFFYKLTDRYFLISNWHVFSGRSPYTGQARRKDAALPDALGLALHRKDHLGGFVEGYSARLDDDQGAVKWLQHQQGQDIDVAVLPIDVFPADCVAYELPRASEASDMAFRVGMDAYILGFPKGIAHQKYLPIWKRASVATEPDIPHDDLPVFLVDTTTREGMSGAPVLLRSFGGYEIRVVTDPSAEAHSPASLVSTLDASEPRMNSAHNWVACGTDLSLMKSSRMAHWAHTS